MATPISFSFFNFRLAASLITVLILLSLKNGHALEGKQVVESNFHSIHFSSLIPETSSCRPSAKGPRRKSSLKVVHRHGPCSQLTQEETKIPTLAEVLAQDQSRVTAIQDRYAFKAGNSKERDSKATIPAQPGISLGTLNYIVKVSLGTPEKSLSLVFDAGSAFTWTQCRPCAGFCYSQQEPIFDPSTSSSYSNITCNSAQCTAVRSATSTAPACFSGTCVYGIRYGDSSFSEGFFGKERLTLTPTDVFDDFLFGCGQNNRGHFGDIAGLIGLGRDPLSLVSQTAQKYGKYFSYCLPTKSGSNGHLTFGNSGVPNGVKFTPFSNSKGEGFYFIEIIALSVAGQQLPISSSVFQNAGSIIDSGTVITRLPRTAYTALRDAFKQQMTEYPLAPAFEILDTCYDFSKSTTMNIPKIGISFSNNLVVDLAITGILVPISISQSSRVMCLAFAGNEDDTDPGIFANVQQQTLEVVYDVAGGQLGLGSGGCA